MHPYHIDNGPDTLILGIIILDPLISLNKQRGNIIIHIVTHFENGPVTAMNINYNFNEEVMCQNVHINIMYSEYINNGPDNLVFFL